MVKVIEQWGLWGIEGPGHYLAFLGWGSCAVQWELLEKDQLWSAEWHEWHLWEKWQVEDGVWPCWVSHLLLKWGVLQSDVGEIQLVKGEYLIYLTAVIHDCSNVRSLLMAPMYRCLMSDPGFSLSLQKSNKEMICCRLYCALLNLVTGWVVLALV